MLWTLCGGRAGAEGKERGSGSRLLRGLGGFSLACWEVLRCEKMGCRHRDLDQKQKSVTGWIASRLGQELKTWGLQMPLSGS